MLQFPLSISQGILISLILGIIFFLLDYYQESQCIQCSQGPLGERYLSLIAGVSVAYFFLFLLPELSAQNFPLLFIDLEFLLLLTGFAFIHVSEKLIIQRSERHVKSRLEYIIDQEKNLDLKEDEIGQILVNTILSNKWDRQYLVDLATAESKLEAKEEELRREDKEICHDLRDQLNENLDQLHKSTDVFYHFLLGLTLYNILLEDILLGSMFFLVAFLKSSISDSTNHHLELIINDKPFIIHTKPITNTVIKVLMASSTLIGIVCAIIFGLFYPLPLISVNLLLAFVSGVILYITVREVIPKDDKGRPEYFLLGLVLFSILIFIFYLFS